MELLDKIYIGELVETYSKMLTKKQETAVRLYYHHDLGLSEIAETENISRQGVRDLVQKSTTQLFSIEEKIGLVRLKNELKKEIETLIKECPSLKEKLDKLKKIME